MIPLTPSTATLRLPRFVYALAGLAASLAHRLDRLAAGWRHRHEAAMLSCADQHILADLGISRGDLNDALSGPPWEDPTVLLRARALERRLGRHGVSHGLSLPSLAPLLSSRRRPCRPPTADRRTV